MGTIADVSVKFVSIFGNPKRGVMRSHYEKRACLYYVVTSSVSKQVCIRYRIVNIAGQPPRGYEREIIYIHETYNIYRYL